MTPIRQGRYLARLAEGPEDMARVHALRWQAFFGARGGAVGPTDGEGLDQDPFDAPCQHLMIEECGQRAESPVLGAFRLLILQDGSQAERSYSAQFYDLSPFATLSGPLAELGRFCMRPGPGNPDVMRLAWGALARLVEAERVGWLFGCSSFPGADPTPHRSALAVLGRHHQGPPHLRPARKAAETVDLGAADGSRAGLPPLLRSYLALGGWVSDHAVIDRRLDTLHVFTALDVKAIPPARARILRQIAQ